MDTNYNILTAYANTIAASLYDTDTVVPFPQQRKLYSENPSGPIVPTPGTATPDMPSDRAIWDGTKKEDDKGKKKSKPEGLTLKEQVTMVTDGIGDLLNAGAVYAKGKFEEAQLKMSARALEINKRALWRDIKDIAYITGVQASNTMKQAAEMKGKQMAAQAEAGFDVSETESYVAQRDYTDLLAQDQINQYAYEAAMAIEGKRNQMAAVEAEQAIKRAEARYVKKMAKVAAGMEVVSGTAKILTGVYL